MSDNLNRAFLYGESVFTTLKCIDGVLQDFDRHFERLCKGAEFLYGPFEESDSWRLYLKERFEKVLKSDGSSVLRLTLFLESERGLQRKRVISINDLKLDVHVSPFIFHDQRWKLRSCPAPHRPEWWPSSFKAGNYLETILSQKMFLRPEDDDLLFVSQEGKVFETSVANIFIVKNNSLFTPFVGPNVLSGIMREKVLNVGAEFFQTCTEASLSLEELKKADAVFGTNSIRGLFLVDRIDDYEITYSQGILRQFENLRSRVFI